MKPILFESERLAYREFDIADAEFFYYLNNDWEVMKYTGDVAFISLEDSRIFLENYNPYVNSGFGRWSVILKETNELIGWCGLKQLDENTVDLGYRFPQKYWGKGYGTESSKKSIEIGFEKYNLVEIIGRTAKANKKSIRILEKIGMTFWKEEGCEGIEDSVFYKIKKEDYGKV